MQPERDIEKLLKAAAEERRRQAGAPFELHPVNRRLLQTEIARQFRQPWSKVSLFFGWLAAIRPRLAFATFALVLLAGGSLWLVFRLNNPALKDAETVHLALNEPRPEVRKDLAPVAAPASPAPAAVVFADKFAGGDNNLATRQREERPLSLPAPVAAPPPPSPTDRDTSAKLALNYQSDAKLRQLAPAGATGFGGSPIAATQAVADLAKAEAVGALATAPAEPPTFNLAKVAAERSSVASVEPAAKPAAADQPAMLLGRVTDELKRAPQAAGPQSGSALARSTGDAGTASGFSPEFFARRYGLAPMAKPELAQQFTRSAFAEKEKQDAVRGPTPPGLLNSFRVETVGGQFRIVDSDGSTYRGTLQPAIAGGSRLLATRGTANPESAGAVGGGMRAKASPTAPAASTVTRSLAESPAGGAVTNAVYYFQVAGTNLTLKQTVVFAGTLTAGPRLLPARAGGGGLSLDGVSPAGGTVTNAASGAAPLTLQDLSTARIQGEAVWGKDQKLQIDAAPGPPR